MASFDVGGYVLAGGKSSRMGQDKALLELAGRPLALLAVMKMQQVCADVHILSSRPELAQFAPLVRDQHEGCGPLGGLEAALGHSRHNWSLFMPVDMPFLPVAFIDGWIRKVTEGESRGSRLAMFTVDGRPQPLFSLLHREVAPFVQAAMERKEYKVFPVLERAGKVLAERQGVALDIALSDEQWDDAVLSCGEPDSETLTKAQGVARHLWFANLNTPEEFAEAERHLDALEISSGRWGRLDSAQ